MKTLAFLAALLFASSAFAQSQPPTNYSAAFNTGGTIAVGGTQVTVKWNLQNPSVRCITNDPLATEDLWVAFSFGQTAGNGVGTPLGPGQQACLNWSGNVSVWAATTGHAFGAFEAGYYQ